MRIQLIAFLLSVQCFTACQQVQEHASPFTADLAIRAGAPNNSRAASKPVTNIVFQSTDAGQTWKDLSAGLPDDTSVDCFSTQNGEDFLGDASGLYRGKVTSTGLVWEKEYMLNGPIQGVSTGRAGAYAFSDKKGFFQNISEDVWVPVFSSLKDQYFRTVFEARDETVFVGTSRGIFKSADRGKTWKHVHKDGWVIKMVESEGVLICTNERGILRSTDGGEHWDLVVSEGGVGIEAEVIKDGFAVITYNTSSKTRRIRISTDAGKTWNAIDENLPPDDSIASIKQVGKYFFCGHPKGVFRTSDQGRSWELIFPSIGDKVFNLSVSGDVIYATPRNKGC